MKELKDRIRRDGIIRAGNVLKVDSFLNHQMDIQLFEAMGQEFRRRFSDVEINKILTIEASGIGWLRAFAYQWYLPRKRRRRIFPERCTVQR